MFVKDIMIKEVVCANEDDSISQVGALILEKKFHGMPVVDKERNIVGIITETDFFTKGPSNIYLPSFIDFLRNEQIDEDSKKNKSIDHVLHATAKDIMSSPCITVKSDLPIKDLIDLFKKRTLKTIPVVNNENKLEGIVTAADIIKLLL